MKTRRGLAVACAVLLALLTACGTVTPRRADEAEEIYEPLVADVRSAANSSVGTLIWDDSSGEPRPQRVDGRCAMSATVIGQLGALPADTAPLLNAVNAALTRHQFPAQSAFGKDSDGTLTLTSTDSHGATLTVRALTTMTISVMIPARPGECH